MTQGKPTEARQDELAGIREKIAKAICYAFYKEGFPAAGDGVVERVAQTLAGLPFPIDDNDLLALTVSSGGGVCPECGGLPVHYRLSFDKPCPTCNGTGQKQPKTLGEIIKENGG